MRESDTTHLTIESADAMRALGRALGAALLDVPGRARVIAIRGDLGAGKTTLVGGVLNAIGVPGTARSPTYTLIEPYDCGQRQFFHLDLYRLADPHEVEALGLRDLLTDDAVLLIEWPERGEGVLPPADLELNIDYSGDERREVSVVVRSEAGRALLRRMA